MTFLEDLLNKLNSVIDKIKSYPLQKALDQIPYNTEDYRYDESLQTWIPKNVNVEEFYGIQIALESLSDSISQANKGVKSIGNVLGAGKSISGIFPTSDFLFNQITVKIYTSAGGLNFFDLEIQITDSSTTQAELLKTHIIEGDRVCLRTFTFNPTHDINYYFKNNGGSEILLDYIFTFSELEQKNTITLDSRVNPSTTMTRQFMKYGSMFNRMRILLYESDTINGNYKLTHKSNSSAMKVELLNVNVTTVSNYNAKHSFNEASFIELAITNNDAVKYLYFQIILFFSISADDTAYNDASWDKNLDSATKNVIRDWIQAHLIPNIHHTPTVAGDLSHNSLANLNAGTDYEHITQVQVDALHSVLTNLTQLATRNHNDLLNINAGTDNEHITQVQKDALHSVLTNLNELATRNHSDLQNKNLEVNIKHLTDAQVGALHSVLTNLTQLATRNHNDLLNMNAGTSYEHITQVQKDLLAHLDQSVLIASTPTFSGLNISGNIVAGGSITLGGGAELGGDLDLHGNNILIEDALSSDGDFEGVILEITHTETFGKAVYVSGNNAGEDADKDALTTMCAIGVSVGNNKVLILGTIREDDWDFTANDVIYVGDDGALTNDISEYTAGDIIQVVGVAIDPNVILVKGIDWVKKK